MGVIERNRRYVGVTCLAAKEVVDKENFIRRFGLSFEKEVYWKGIAGLLEHLSRSPFFKAVLVTTSNIPFKLEPDVRENPREGPDGPKEITAFIRASRSG